MPHIACQRALLPQQSRTEVAIGRQLKGGRAPHARRRAGDQHRAVVGDRQRLVEHKVVEADRGRQTPQRTPRPSAGLDAGGVGIDA